jgi:prevent-host-death family protein
MDNAGATRKVEAPERISATDARDRLTELMNRVAFGGARFILTKNGEPVAALIGIADLERITPIDVDATAVAAQ